MKARKVLAASVLALLVFSVAALASEVTTVTFITRGSAAKHHQALAEMFNKQSKNVKVDVEVVAGGTPPYLERVRIGVAGGHPADIMMVDEGIEISMMADDMLMDILPFVRRGGFPLDAYFPGLRAFHVRDGRMYSISLGSQGMVLVVNEDTLGARGVPLPDRSWQRTWTWDELRVAARKLVIRATDPGANDRAAIVIHNSTDDWLPILWQNGGDVFRKTADGKTRSAFGEPTARMTLEMLQEMYHVERVARTSGNPETGETAMGIEGTWVLGSDFKIDAAWGVYPLPRGRAGAATQVNSNGAAILRDSRNPEAAWEFLKWLADEGMPAVVATNKFGVPPDIKMATRLIDGMFTCTPSTLDRRVILEGFEVGRSKPVLFYGDVLQVTREGFIPSVIENTMAVATAIEQIVERTNQILEKAGL